MRIKRPMENVMELTITTTTYESIFKGNLLDDDDKKQSKFTLIKLNYQIKKKPTTY